MTLQERGEQIDRELMVERQKLKRRLESDYEKLEEQKEILRSDEANTDRSENALFQIAKDKSEMYNQSITIVSKKIRAYDSYKELVYVPNGTVQIGSVVHLIHQSTAGNPPPANRPTEFRMKIVPTGLGNGRIGALSVDSECAKQLIGMCAGETFKIYTHVGPCVYYIKEVY